MKLGTQNLNHVDLIWDVSLALLLTVLSIWLSWAELSTDGRDIQQNLIIIALWSTITLSLLIMVKNIRGYRPLKAAIAVVLAFPVSFHAYFLLAERSHIYTVGDWYLFPICILWLIAYGKVYITLPAISSVYSLIKGRLQHHAVARSNPSK